MKVLTLLGTRPEIIRLSLVIAGLDRVCDHVLVHTGQNYDLRLKDLFFEELGVRAPDATLRATGSFGEQVGAILSGCEQLFAEHRPDRILILGDTTSGLGAIVAKRMGIPVYHMEAGNRCYDDRVPEEVNRRIIDHSSDVLLPYTENSRRNLLAEGLPGARVIVTGNPIWEVIRHHQARIDASTILQELGVAPTKFFLVTLHRAENVDEKARLLRFTEALARVQREHGLPVIISTHPRTKAKMEAFGVETGGADLRFLPPFGFFDFLALERAAACVLSDSGTVQEECCLLKVPNVTLRDVTERPETVECGSNLLSGSDPERIQACVRMALASPCGWTAPAEYLRTDVSETVVRLLLSHREGGRA
jgi:UDP-N-acetylglucosamine 2-epimerase (non-hydrolysing)